MMGRNCRQRPRFDWFGTQEIILGADTVSIWFVSGCSTCIEPGPFRTDWSGRSLRQTPNRIEAYAETAGARLPDTSERSGTQAGDPVRAAHAMIHVTEIPDPPRYLVLGRRRHDAVTAKLRERTDEIAAWRDRGLATDQPHLT